MLLPWIGGWTSLDRMPAKPRGEKGRREAEQRGGGKRHEEWEEKGATQGAMDGEAI